MKRFFFEVLRNVSQIKIRFFLHFPSHFSSNAQPNSNISKKNGCTFFTFYDCIWNNFLNIILLLFIHKMHIKFIFFNVFMQFFPHNTEITTITTQNKNLNSSLSTKKKTSNTLFNSNWILNGFRKKNCFGVILFQMITLNLLHLTIFDSLHFYGMEKLHILETTRLQRVFRKFVISSLSSIFLSWNEVNWADNQKAIEPLSVLLLIKFTGFPPDK